MVAPFARAWATTLSRTRSTSDRGFAIVVIHGSTRFSFSALSRSAAATVSGSLAAFPSTSSAASLRGVRSLRRRGIRFLGLLGLGGRFGENELFGNAETFDTLSECRKSGVFPTFVGGVFCNFQLRLDCYFLVWVAVKRSCKNFDLVADGNSIFRRKGLDEVLQCEILHALLRQVRSQPVLRRTSTGAPP